MTRPTHCNLSNQNQPHMTATPCLCGLCTTHSLSQARLATCLAWIWFKSSTNSVTETPWSIPCPVWLQNTSLPIRCTQTGKQTTKTNQHNMVWKHLSLVLDMASKQKCRWGWGWDSINCPCYIIKHKQPASKRERPATWMGQSWQNCSLSQTPSPAYDETVERKI